MLIFSITLLLFQYKPVQTWAAKKAAGYLSEKLHTKIGIKSLYVKPFSTIVIEGLYVLDLQKDTILNTPKLQVDLNGFSLFSSLKAKKIDFSLIQLDGASVYLKKQKDSTSNLKFILDYFSSKDTAKSTAKPWKMVFEKIAVNNLRFRYKNFLIDTLIKGVNFDDVDVQHLSAVLGNMDIVNHLFKADVSNFTLREKSGFYVKKLNTYITIDTNQILAQHLLLLTDRSALKDYFRMKFKSFSEMSDHIEDRVYMEGDFKSSRISSADIAFFTTGLEHIRFDLGVEGRIKGYVNNLSAKSLMITGGKATYVKGDFKIKGLPNWDKTFMELKFDQVATNKTDLDYLYSNFTGTRNAHVPVIVSKFGNVNFMGNFTGMQNDFAVSGTFKTALGRFDPNVKVKISKAAVPSYAGNLKTHAFNIGGLLNEQTLGRVTFDADFKGSGDDLKTLNTTLNARISQVDFKGYNYQNLTVNGNFNKKTATAKITVNDKNIQLNLNGNINLNAAMPAYDINATLNNANLRNLKLLDDTITITAQIKTKITGNGLNNLTGSLNLTGIRIVDPRNNYVVDTLFLNASGTGLNRAINLQSDIADGFLKGSYDLETLPSYFKTIVKKYIPSLKTTIVKPGPQNFSFNLTLKNADPAIALFMPDLKIPDQGTLIGQFNSATQTATLNFYIKTIKYGKIVFHDFIIDESTSNDFLGLNLSLSKVNFSDSLFVKDITVTNFLKKDSLNFNVKLSDKNAVNQLDLYGLVNFGRDTTAKLQLLPSDIILEREKWRLDRNVRIRFLNGKTEVSGFQLSNQQQKVKINGFLSDDPADKLKVTFDKFRMETIDQLTKSAGVHLTGSMNGDVILSSITKSPGVDAQLDVDSLAMNKTLVGNVKLNSQLGSDRKNANVNLSVTNHGLQTVNVSGVYQFGKETSDNLNFAVNMNNTEAIIFEPFIKDLVSNIRGTISTNLTLTGPPSKPQLNGNIILNNTGVTVNYLNTAYTVIDTVAVKNSVITLDGMVMRDAAKGTGIVKGTVDINDPSNPDIEVVLDAKNLMALNTTFKQNHLYYGTAYGTGKFSFSGPVNNMDIDINAKTEAGTVFNIPLNTSSTVGDYDFINFVSHNDTSKKTVSASNAFNGVTLNFSLSVDEKTTVKIFTDYGVLEGNGEANDLKLNINSLGDFEMFGDFLITSGKFDFTAKNFISKNFTVNQGGTIRWTGNPSNANINLTAIYEVRTDIEPLYQAAGSQSPRGKYFELVQARLNLTNTLVQPDINFDFNFPLDPSVKDDLSNYLSDNNNRSQQALSIIVRRQFSNGANNNLTNQVAGTAGEAISEFAFNKLNGLVSQSNIKGLDLNIRSFNDFSASYRVRDRLVFTGSLFSTSTSSTDLFNNSAGVFNSGFNQLTGDFEAQYLLRQNGDLRAQYSYRVLNTTTLNALDGGLTAEYVNGVGLVYQRDFDTFGEFVRNLLRPHRKKQPVAPSPIPSTTTTSAPAAAIKPDEED